MKRKRRSLKSPGVPKNRGSPPTITNIGDISGGKGFAIGPGAKAFVLEISGLFNFTNAVKFIRQYSLVTGISLILQGLVIALWSKYTDRFLISFWILIIIMGFLQTSILTGFCMKIKNKVGWQYTTAFVLSLLILVTVSAFEYKRITDPPEFPTEIFGVAIAQFGQGLEFNITPKSREISQLVLQQLKRQASENPDLRFIQFRPIGLIKTQDEATQDGLRIRADLVIWGQLQVSEEQTILNFSIIETPDKVSNPMFPRVLPLYEIAANSFFKINGQQSDDISRGTTTISAFTFGLANFFKRDFAAAARAFEEALALTSYEKEDDYHYLIYFYYGLTLQRLDKLEEANEKLQQAISLHPDDPAPWVASAFDNNSLGNIEEAQRQAKVAFDLYSNRIQLRPDDYVNYFDRAQANEILRDLDSALADYQTAKERAPNLYIAYIGIARIQIMLDQPNEAIQSCKEAIDLAESRGANPAWAYLYLGHTYELIGDSNNARFAFDKATKLAPEVDYMHYRMGQYLEKTGDRKDLLIAEEEYKSTIALSGNKAWAHSTFANFLTRQNRLEEAITEYRSALQYDPQAVKTWTEFAEVLARLKLYAQARQAYDHAIKVDANYLYARLSYGTFLFNQGEYEPAIREWEIARQIAPGNCDLLLNLGLAHERLGDRQQAEVLYRIASSNTVEQDRECQMEATRRLKEYLP